jgi:hypothetical protein
MTQLEILEEIEAVDFAEEEEDIEGESANQKKLQLKEISETVVAGSDWTTATIRDQLIRENIQLNPRFQRRDVTVQGGRRTIAKKGHQNLIN